MKKELNTAQIRVLSYNIHKGFTSYNKKFVLKHIREAVENTQADLVFLQEVIGENNSYKKNHQNWPDTSQFEFIADRIWPHFAYGKNAVYVDGHHGNAILSKFPIRSWENIDISMNQLENRGLLHAVIDIPDQSKPVHAICIHLGLFEDDRRKQIEQLCIRINAIVPADEPLLVAGDFNDWRKQVTQTLFKKADLKETFLELQGDHPRTFPSWMPILKLDRIYFRGLTASLAKRFSGQPWNTLSDHSAILGQFGF